MVPQPVLAVILCYPITEESEAANKKGEVHVCCGHQNNHVRGILACSTG